MNTAMQTMLIMAHSWIQACAQPINSLQFMQNSINLGCLSLAESSSFMAQQQELKLRLRLQELEKLFWKKDSVFYQNKDVQLLALFVQSALAHCQMLNCEDKHKGAHNKHQKICDDIFIGYAEKHFAAHLDVNKQKQDLYPFLHAPLFKEELYKLGTRIMKAPNADSVLMASALKLILFPEDAAYAILEKNLTVAESISKDNKLDYPSMLDLSLCIDFSNCCIDWFVGIQMQKPQELERQNIFVGHLLKNICYNINQHFPEISC